MKIDLLIKKNKKFYQNMLDGVDFQMYLIRIKVIGAMNTMS